MGMVERGDIVIVNFEPIKGHEQGGTRPAVVIQNNLGNIHSLLTIVAPVTSKVFNKTYPTNVFLRSGDSRLEKDSTIMLNQIRTIDKRRIKKILGALDLDTMKRVDAAIKISLGLN